MDSGAEILGYLFLAYLALLFLPDVLFRFSAELTVDLSERSDSSRFENFIASSLPSCAFNFVAYVLYEIVDDFYAFGQWGIAREILADFFTPSDTSPVAFVVPVNTEAYSGVLVADSSPAHDYLTSGNLAPAALYIFLLYFVALVCGRLWGWATWHFAATGGGQDEFRATALATFKRVFSRSTEPQLLRPIFYQEPPAGAAAETDAKDQLTGTEDTSEETGSASDEVSFELIQLLGSLEEDAAQELIEFADQQASQGGPVRRLLRDLKSLAAFLCFSAGQLFYLEHLSPLWTWTVFRPWLFVRTIDNRVFFGRFHRYDKDRHADLMVIHLTNVYRYCWDEVEQRARQGRLAVSAFGGALAIRWDRIADINRSDRTKINELVLKLVSGVENLSETGGTSETGGDRHRKSSRFERFRDRLSFASKPSKNRP